MKFNMKAAADIAREIANAFIAEAGEGDLYRVHGTNLAVGITRDDLGPVPHVTAELVDARTGRVLRRCTSACRSTEHVARLVLDVMVVPVTKARGYLGATA